MSRKSQNVVQLMLAYGVLLPLLYSQVGGRFETGKRLGIAYLEGGQYDKAAARLEEIWEQDQSDPTVAEYLAMAYLNTEDRASLKRTEKIAFELIEKSMKANSRASFLVQHSHEKLTWLQGRELNQYCSGKLSIIGDKLIYEGTSGEKARQHSFSVPLSKVSVDLNPDNEKGVFRVSANGNSLTMVTRNRNRHESSYLVQLIRKQIASH